MSSSLSLANAAISGAGQYAAYDREQEQKAQRETQEREIPVRIDAIDAHNS